MEPLKNTPTSSPPMTTAAAEQRRCACGAALSAETPWFDSCAKCYRLKRNKAQNELNRRVYIAEATAAKALAGLDPTMSSESWGRLRSVVSVSRHYDRDLVERILHWIDHNRQKAFEAERKPRRRG